MDSLHIIEASTEEQFRAMSLIHALGWRSAYPDAVPAQWMAEHVTDDRWVDLFRQYAADGVNHGLLLYRGAEPVACLTFGPARTDAGLQAGSVCQFHSEGYQGWGELISVYTHPAETGKGYGSLLVEEALSRLKAQGFSNVYVFVLRENQGARRFYARHGFTWDGTQEEIPFPPDTICVDLRYVRHL